MRISKLMRTHDVSSLHELSELVYCLGTTPIDFLRYIFDAHTNPACYKI